MGKKGIKGGKEGRKKGPKRGSKKGKTAGKEGGTKGDINQLANRTRLRKAQAEKIVENLENGPKIGFCHHCSEFVGYVSNFWGRPNPDPCPQNSSFRGVGGEAEAPIYFLWARGFSDRGNTHLVAHPC